MDKPHSFPYPIQCKWCHTVIGASDNAEEARNTSALCYNCKGLLKEEIMTQSNATISMLSLADEYLDELITGNKGPHTDFIQGLVHRGPFYRWGGEKGNG